MATRGNEEEDNYEEGSVLVLALTTSALAAETLLPPAMTSLFYAARRRGAGATVRLRAAIMAPSEDDYATQMSMMEDITRGVVSRSAVST